MNKSRETKRTAAMDSVIGYFKKHLPMTSGKYGHLGMSPVCYAARVRCEPDNKADDQSPDYFDVSVIMLGKHGNRTGLRIWTCGDMLRQSIEKSGVRTSLIKAGLNVVSSDNMPGSKKNGHGLYDIYRAAMDWEQGLSSAQIKKIYDDFVLLEHELHVAGFWK